MEKNFWIIQQIGQKYTILRQYFSVHWLDFIIVLFVFIVLILNCVKSYLIFILKKGKGNGKADGTKYKCKFLKTTINGDQYCTNPYYSERFKNEDSCFLENNKRCKGFLVAGLSEMDMEDLLSTSQWKYLLFLANWGTSLLPYVALIRTILLAITVVEVK